MNNQPLAGVKVLDLTRVLAGPLCTMLLADLGAQVIKVERPGAGDETRGWGPPFDTAGSSAYFLAINRNKLSIAADFRDDDDVALIARLMREADVVVENFLPSIWKRVAISPEKMIAENSRLIWCTITGFGAGSQRPGYDFVVQAEAGWMAVTGEPLGAPMKSGIALADVIAGKDAAIAILAALIGGAGGSRHLIISLMDSARAALINVAQNALVTGSEARRWGNAHANLVPYQLFQASDRELVIAVGSDAQWVACVRAMDIHDLGADPALATNAGRVRNRERLVATMSAALASQPAEHWMRRLSDAGVPCGIVKSVLEALEDATTASALTGMPSSMAGTVRFPPPTLDQHGEPIRRQGWDVFRGYL